MNQALSLRGFQNFQCVVVLLCGVLSCLSSRTRCSRGTQMIDPSAEDNILDTALFSSTKKTLHVAENSYDKRIGRNLSWQEWYPNVIPDFSELEVGTSPYGPPNTETLDLFHGLPGQSQVLDVAGGDGRYALPLARMGLRVVVSDVDMPHLRRLRTNTQGVLPRYSRTIYPVLADVTEPLPFPNAKFDGVLSAGFAYLVPPKQLELIFAYMSDILKPGGLLVVEFATNRDRRDKDGRSLIGEREYNYSHEEGLYTLQMLFRQCGLEFSKRERTIHFEMPYFLHNDLIIAHGLKR